MVSNKHTLAKIKQLFPDSEITILPALGKDKGIGNPKKLEDMKKLLGKVKFPLPTR